MDYQAHLPEIDRSKSRQKLLVEKEKNQILRQLDKPLFEPEPEIILSNEQLKHSLNSHHAKDCTPNSRTRLETLSSMANPFQDYPDDDVVNLADSSYNFKKQHPDRNQSRSMAQNSSDNQ